MSEWKEYTGSDEQIAEMEEAQYGVLLSSNPSEVIDLSNMFNLEWYLSEQSVHAYLICNPHPLADMICRQARTGQPVWWKYKTRQEVYPCLVSPDWDDVNCEYSFTEFKE